MNHPNIVKRLLYLRNMEFINIIILPICLYVVLVSLKIQNWQPYAFSLFIICFILMQGTFYWHLKLQEITKTETTSLPNNYQIFSFFKIANVVLLSIYPILIVFGQIKLLINFQVTVWSNAIYIFAILEHINYYYYQLMHDNMNDINYLIKHKKIRRSPLFTDLQKIKARVRKQTAG